VGPRLPAADELARTSSKRAELGLPAPPPLLELDVANNFTGKRNLINKNKRQIVVRTKMHW
jgi:hypothetical protein